jgi:hypothetical protein
MNTSTKVRCQKCGSENIIYGIQYSSSGAVTIKAQCDRCGNNPDPKHPFYNKTDFDITKLPVWNDNRAISEPCERCGSTHGTQLHHYAPKSVFNDADNWATGYLCDACHKEWHVTIRDYPWKDWKGYR